MPYYGPYSPPTPTAVSPQRVVAGVENMRMRQFTHMALLEERRKRRRTARRRRRKKEKEK
jgi:hypothetical protein